MALARDSSSPASFTLLGNGTDTPSPGSCSSFTPPLGSLLVLSLALNRNYTVTPTITITTTSGSTTSWTEAVRINDAAGGVAAIYTATVLSSVATTVQVSTSATTPTTYPNGSEQAFVWIDVWTGANGIGATTTGTSTSQTINPTITTTANNSRVTGVGNDWNAKGIPTSSDIAEGLSTGSSWLSAIRAYKSADTSSSGTSVPINIVAAASGPEWAYALIEIKASTSVGGYVKRWNGSSWEFRVLKRWTGSAWQQESAQIYHNSAWAYTYSNTLSTTSAWNPSDAASGLTISGTGNLKIASSSYTSGTFKNARSTTSKSSGKRYVEFAITGDPTDPGNLGIGLANATASLTANYLGYDTNSTSYFATGFVGYNGNAATYSTYTNGDIVMMAYDFGTGKVWYGKNGTWNGDPGAGTGGISVSGIGTPAYLGFTAEWSGGTASATMNTGHSAWAYSLPSGFTAWDL